MLQQVRYKKGQVAVIDLFISAVLFGIILTSIMVTWNSYNVKIAEQISYNELVIKSFHISDLLSKYKGNPERWDELGVVDTLGLAEEEGVVSTNKLNNFTEMDYDEIRDRLNINAYGFYFNLTDAVGNDFDSIFLGNKSGTQVVNVRRLVLYEDQEAVMEVAVWQ